MSEIIDAKGTSLTRAAQVSIEEWSRSHSDEGTAIREAFVDTTTELCALGEPTAAAWAGVSVGRVFAVDENLWLVTGIGNSGAVAQRLQRSAKARRGGANKWVPTTDEPCNMSPEVPILWAEAGGYDGYAVEVRQPDEAMNYAAKGVFGIPCGNGK